MVFARWMFVGLAYATVFVLAPIAILAAFGFTEYPDWTMPIFALVGVAFGGLAPLRHMDWIDGD